MAVFAHGVGAARIGTDPQLAEDEDSKHRECSNRVNPV